MYWIPILVVLPHTAYVDVEINAICKANFYTKYCLSNDC